jgi:hypothetical protein
LIRATLIRATNRTTWQFSLQAKSSQVDVVDLLRGPEAKPAPHPKVAIPMRENLTAANF